MQIEAACFTRCGEELGKKLAGKLAGAGVAFGLSRCGAGGPTVHAWAAQHFAGADALLFIGAAGIAVRAVAPHVAGKTSDPAVVVVDEAGRYAIPLLSGHIGGANALARRLAGLLGAEAVITTATDVNGVFAVDTWATENGYHIQNPKQIKTVAARLLAGEAVGLYSLFPIKGGLPGGIAHTGQAETAQVAITVYDGGRHPGALCLTPPALVLGVGCRRGTPAEGLQAAFAGLCAKQGLHPAAIGAVCSIDLKKDEPGLLAFCERHGWPLCTYSAGALAAAPGVYTASAFVEETTGTDNVCERSAVLGSGPNGRLLVDKTAGNGVALAVAQKAWTVEFGEDI